MEKCNDPKCPKCGNIKIRGNVFTGIVTSAKADKTVTNSENIYIPMGIKYIVHHVIVF